jgi:hypothetical protein
MHAERNRSPRKTAERMSRRCRRFTVCGWFLVLILAAASGFAQETPAQEKSEPGSAKDAPKVASAPAISPAKDALIRRLLELTGAKKNALEFGQQLGDYLNTMLQRGLPAGEHKQQIGETLVSKLMARLSSDEMIVRLVPIYDKAFTEQDLKSIVGFYETAAGKRLLEATPMVMEEANDVSEKWIRELIPQIMQQMTEQFPELKEQFPELKGGGK